MELRFYLALLQCAVLPFVVVGAPIIYDISDGRGVDPINAAVGTQLGDSVVQHDTWTGGVDSQLSMAQAELAVARARSVQGRNAIHALRTKANKEKQDLKMAVAKDPKGPHISSADIDASYNRLIKYEEDLMTDSHSKVGRLNTYIGKLMKAKKKIVKAKLGVVAIEEMEKSKREQEHVVAHRLYRQFKQQEDGNFDTWKKSVEKAMRVKHELKTEQDVWDDRKKNMNIAEKAQKEIREKMHASDADSSDTEKGIIERIRAQSDDKIRKLTIGTDQESIEAGKEFDKSKAKAVVKESQIEKDSVKLGSYQPDKNITKMNEILQQNANAAALDKLMSQKQEDDMDDDTLDDDTLADTQKIEHEYEAYKVFEHSSKQQELTDNLETNDKILNLTAWHTAHKQMREELVTDYLSKVRTQDSRDNKLNMAQLEAYHLAQRKKALLEIIRLRKEIPVLEKHEAVLQAERVHLEGVVKGHGELENLHKQIQDVHKEISKAHQEESDARKALQDFTVSHPSAGSEDDPHDFVVESEKKFGAPTEQSSLDVPPLRT